VAKSDRPYAFPPGRRVRRSPEFDAVYKQGRRVTTRYFVLYGLKTDRDGARLGLTVSRKIGNAVCRNRVKRVLRDIFRRTRPSLFQCPYDVIINVRRGIDEIPYQALEAAFSQAVAQLHQDPRPRG